MRCASFALANGLLWALLKKTLRQMGTPMVAYASVLHLKWHQGVVFCFMHGSIVCWGLTRQQEQHFITWLLPFCKQKLNHLESRYFACHIGDVTRFSSHPRFHIEIITLESDTLDLKLAVSYGLAQSIQLEGYEDTVLDVIVENQPLIDELAHSGSVTLHKRAILKRVGSIFGVRSFVNLHGELLTTPDFFWENPNLESYYLRIKEFLDITHRVVALNQQLDVLHELLNVLHSQLQHKHSSFLETIIVLLVGLELVLTSLQMVLGYVGWRS
jgi:uncharacterized Rmd1/YagE family protein